MKKLSSIIITLLLGVLIGWSVTRERAQQNETSEELAKLYPTEVALRAMKDMRVLTLLNSNDVVMAKKLLIQDLDMQMSVLSHLRRESRLSEFDIQALKDAGGFLKESK